MQTPNTRHASTHLVALAQALLELLLGVPVCERLLEDGDRPGEVGVGAGVDPVLLAEAPVCLRVLCHVWSCEMISERHIGTKRPQQNATHPSAEIMAKKGSSKVSLRMGKLAVGPFPFRTWACQG